MVKFTVALFTYTISFSCGFGHFSWIVGWVVV